MGKQELKEQLEIYKNLNDELTARICYLILWKEKYIIAKKQDWKSEEEIQEEIEIVDWNILLVEEKLNNHYTFN